MKSSLRVRNRGRSRTLSAVPPPITSIDYSPELAACAASILFRSPLSLQTTPSVAQLAATAPATQSSNTHHAVYILNAAALPDTREVDYDKLLPYVLARLPGEDELVGGTEYEIVFFAGGKLTERRDDGGKHHRPGWGWLVQAYAVLSRAMRKRLRKLYVVHERRWVRMLAEMFSTMVSPKFRRKIVHGKNDSFMIY
jgi:Rho GTPase-activating protein 1